MNGILHIDHFIAEPDDLYRTLLRTISWDERMAARKTVSFGKAYNYSQISYPDAPFLPDLEALLEPLASVTGLVANNCLANYYPDGSSKMGYHADRTDDLEAGTGIAIVSLGTTRHLKFKHINDPDLLLDYALVPGSLIYMTQEIQHSWLHAIPKADTTEGRISLTFRRMVM
jgi:alkylated DNA repair dioxygenase AlkB